MAQYTGLSQYGEQAAWNTQIDRGELQFYMQGVQRADKFRQNNFYKLFSLEEDPQDVDNHTDGFQPPDHGELDSSLNGNYTDQDNGNQLNPYHKNDGLFDLGEFLSQ